MGTPPRELNAYVASLVRTVVVSTATGSWDAGAARVGVWTVGLVAATGACVATGELTGAPAVSEAWPVESARVADGRGVLLVGKSRGGATMTIAVSSNARKKRLSIVG
jgi:hypothetical protein